MENQIDRLEQAFLEWRRRNERGHINYGKFDSARRFYIAESERQPCCKHIVGGGKFSHGT